MNGEKRKRAVMIEGKNGKKKPWRLFAGAAIVISVAAIAGQSVLASLNATAFNTTAQNVDAGTLKLGLTDNGVGFSQNITNMAPGDIVNRYVTLKNEGSLDGQLLSLKTTQTGTATLISDGVNGSSNKGLTLTVTGCTVAWTPTTGVCSGTTSDELVKTTIGSLTSEKTLTSAIMNSGAFKYLKMSIQLPDQSETTINGALPANTVQGGSVAITYTFNLAQRTATTTNS